MIAYWLKLSEQVNEKSMRERVIIALLLFAVIYGLAELMLLTPMKKDYEGLLSHMDTLHKEMSQLNAQEKVFAEALTNDPNAVKKKELEQLESRVKQLDVNLEKLSIGLIQAEKLPQALQAVLGSTNALKLIGMRTHAPNRLDIQNAELTEDVAEDTTEKEPNIEYAKIVQDTKSEKIGVFKYVVTIELEGKYFDVVNYLQALEALPWKVYWQKVDYQVKQYPQARVSIEVYTLSTEEGVLGV